MTAEDPSTFLRSQHGEDRAVAEYFGAKREGYFVELGAHDGVALSNTFYLEKVLEWRGTLIEADPLAAADCVRNRPGSTVWNRAVVGPKDVGFIDFHVCTTASEFSTVVPRGRSRDFLGSNHTAVKVEATTLDSLLQASGARRIDFASIDVEGHERGVLAGFNLRLWRPRVLLLEINDASGVLLLPFLVRGKMSYRRRFAWNYWFEPATGVVDLLLSTSHLLLLLAPVTVRGVVREALRACRLLSVVRRLRSSVLQ